MLICKYHYFNIYLNTCILRILKTFTLVKKFNFLTSNKSEIRFTYSFLLLFFRTLHLLLMGVLRKEILH